MTPGNPRSTTVYWTKVENSGFRQNGHTLHVPNIQRTSSGTYRCTAENNYSNGEKGTHNQSMVVNVFCMRSEYNYMIMMTIDSRLIVQNDGNQFKKSVKEKTFALYSSKPSDIIKGNGHCYCGSNMLPSNLFSFHDLINKCNDNSINKNDE